MATYEELINSAEQIRTNELPESNTHELVGKHLKNQVEHFNSENQGVKGQIAALNKNTGIFGYPVWKPNTAYAKGVVILNPDGQLVKSLVEQTNSGTSYNSGLWETTSMDKENMDKVAELDVKINKGSFTKSSTSAPDVNDVIKELYVFDKKYDSVALLTLANNTLSLTIRDSTGNMPDAYVLNEEYIENKVYEIRTSDYILQGYVVFSGVEVSYSGASISIEPASYQQYNSPILQSYITSNVDTLSNRPISSNSTFNLNVKELFIDTDDKDAEFSVLLFRLNMVDQSYTDLVYLQKNGTNYAKLEISDLIADFVYNMEILDNSGDSAYIVFSDYSKDTINQSSLKWILNKDIIFSYSQNPIIETSIIKSILPKEDLTLSWTSDALWNKYIKECYLPNFTDKYGEGYKLRALRSSKEGMTFHIYGSDSTTIIETCSKDVTEDYYKNNAITPLYDYNTKDLIGWVMLNYLGEDFNQSSSSGRPFNAQIVEDINNSPTIKAMLVSDEQIILTGDSLQGQPQENSLPDILRGLTGKQVWNISCGGCRMAWRTEDGSNYYDKFTFSNLMEAIAKNDFSEQLEAISGEMPTDYKVQYANMKMIDLSKKTTIVCNYMTNDLTGGTEIGDLWKYTDVISAYDRKTFLGAMNYGITKILTAYPLFKFVFLGNFYRLLDDSNGDRVIPPYQWTNDIGKKADDYMIAEKENCYRIGLNVFDTTNWGVRNAFNMANITTDGTHFNAHGFAEYAKLLKKLVE